MASPALDWPEIYDRLVRDQNDSAAYTALSRRVATIARSALWAHGSQLVEDVVADTCSAVMVGIHRARGGATFRGFVIGIYLNSRRFYLEQHPASVPLDGIDLPAEHVAVPNYDELALLQHCIGELSLRERTAVHLHFFDDAPYRQIAEVLKVTDNNARQIVYTAKAHLTSCVQRLWPAGRG